MPQLPFSNCCGCTACRNICPKSAIQMLPDSEGFSYPGINADLCVECGRCEKVCPVLHEPSVPSSYVDCVVVQSTDPEVLDESTSGGFIDALYRYVLEDCNGCGVGVTFGDDFLPKHIITDSYEKAKEFRNSKYAQSDLSDVFSHIRKLLMDEKLLLFVGTPCQVAGLKSFLGKDYDNLITVDLVCRSIPSPKLWRKYLDWQECRYRSKVKKVFCRKKTYGYHSGALEIEFENGKRYAGSNRVDYYMKSFHSDQCSRPSCYDCRFKTKHRCSDFTVFDSWNPQAVALSKLVDNDRGYSNVIVHSEKGKKILNQMKDIVLIPADPEKMFEFTGGMESHSIQYKPGRATYYIDLDRIGFENTAKKYITVSPKDHLIERAKPLRSFIKRICNKK